MFATLLTWKMALNALNNNPNGDIEVGFGAPLVIDLVTLYIIGATLGVFPTVV